MIYNLKLKELRTNKNLSQDKIASILGLARVTYNHYEVQENIIPLKHLIYLANFYNVSIDYLLGLTNIYNYKNSKNNIDTKLYKERLKNFRKEQKLTQEKLANYLRTTKSVVCKFEKMDNLIATPFLYMICDKYKISADYLLGRTNSPKYLNK